MKSSISVRLVLTRTMTIRTSWPRSRAPSPRRRWERGVAICGSGVGACVCANKIAGVRAALIEDHFSAGQGVEDDHLNVLCLGGRTEGSAVAWDLVEAFLAARYSQAERHLRRLSKVAALEAASQQKGQPT